MIVLNDLNNTSEISSIMHMQYESKDMFFIFCEWSLYRYEIEIHWLEVQK